MKFKLFLISCLLITTFVVSAQNLITDGSFPTTGSSFSTNLQYKCNIGAFLGSEYCVNATGWGGSDHSTPSDWVMLVNSFDILPANPLIWGKTIAVHPGNTYDFTFYHFGYSPHCACLRSRFRK